VKTSFLTFSLAASLALGGCSLGSSGGPGATDSGSRRPIVGQADDTFQLSTPETSLRQGETKSVIFTIRRSVNFEEDVLVGFADLPKGLSVDNKHPLIKHGDSEAHFALTATDDASLGDFTLQVTSHPTNGVDATNKFFITVTKK
jgi:hypothetical protein